MQDMQPQEPNLNPSAGAELPSGELDREGAMAKADLHKLAQYSFKLFKKIQDEDQLEGWVQAKITKAADYIASVYHYLEYEMEFSEYGQKLDNSEMYSESQKEVLRARLNEAKEKVKALKMAHADKVSEGIFGGDTKPCEACGGAGHVVTPERSVPGHVQAKIDKYNQKAKAMSAATRRVDKNKNGIPDDEEFDEDFESLKKSGDSAKTSKGGTVTKTDTGVKHTRDPKSYSDEPHAEPKSNAKSRSASEKEGDKAADKAQEKDSKDYEKKNPGTVTRVKDGKKTENYGQGVYESELKKTGDTKKTKTGVLTKTDTGVKHTNTSHSDEPHTEPKSVAKSRSAAEKSGDKAADKAQEKDSKAYEKAHPGTVKRYKDGKLVAEALKGGQKKLDQDKDGDIEADDLAMLRNLKKGKKVKEAKEEKFDALKHVKNPTKGEKDAAKDVKRGSYADRAAMLKSAEADDRLKEAKPSAGLSKAKKSAVVKDAKAGKDIGKPGKSFDAVAKKAGGGEKGKKIAAAAMWKNIKEGVKVAEASKKAKPDFLDMDKDGDKKEPMKKAVADKKEVVKESADTTRIRQLMQRLNG